MNIFILNSGRCGSMTFSKACRFIINFTAGHESLATKVGEERLNYPDNHIESDCRLAYFLGGLDKKFGKDAYYVHLTRNEKDCVESFKHRLNDKGIIYAHSACILMNYNFPRHLAEPNFSEKYIVNYLDTINENIRMFLKDKPHKMNFQLETAKEDFKIFWNWIGAKGNLEKALGQWDIKHNATKI